MRKLILFFGLIWLCNTVQCQDFTFIWEVNPSLGNRSYTVSINKKQSISTITLRKSFSKKEKKKKFKKIDRDSLTTFLNKYSFPYRSSSNFECEAVQRDYLYTKFLPDGQRVIIEKDTFFSERLKSRHYDYKYDSIEHKYYFEWRKKISFTDGTSFKGEYITKDFDKKFYIYCVWIKEKDYELNKMIYRFVTRYFKFEDYQYLGKIIEDDKPRKKSPCD